MKDAKIHHIREDSGAVFRRKSRRHALEIMAAKGEISRRQCEYIRAFHSPSEAMKWGEAQTSPHDNLNVQLSGRFLV